MCNDMKYEEVTNDKAKMSINGTNKTISRRHEVDLVFVFRTGNGEEKYKSASWRTTKREQ